MEWVQHFWRWKKTKLNFGQSLIIMIMKPMPAIGLKMDFVPPFLNASHIRHKGAICLKFEFDWKWPVQNRFRNDQNIWSPPKSQIKPKAVWAHRWFSQNTNKRIYFVCCEKQKSKQNKFVCPFLGRIYGASICFRFYLTFRVNFRVFVLFKFEFEWFANLLVILKALLNCEVIVFAQLSEWLKGPEASNLKLKKWKKKWWSLRRRKLKRVDAVWRMNKIQTQ